MQVLLVEQDPALRHRVRILLESRGHEVTAAPTAETAEALGDLRSYPLIVLDWSLSGREGRALCRRVRAEQRDPQPLILVLIDARAVDDLPLMLAAGVDDYIPTPLDLTVVQTRLAITESRVFHRQRLADLAATSRRQTVELAQQMQALQERDLFFNMSLDMLALAGPDGYLKRVNASFTRTLGYSEAELLEQQYLQLVHPDDVASTLDAAQRLAEGQPVRHFENRYRCRDGSYRWLDWVATPGPEGTIFAVARDVTAKRDAHAALQFSEARFRRLAEHAPDIIHRLEFQPEPHYSYVSPSVFRVLGYTPEVFTSLAAQAEALIHPDDLPAQAIAMESLAAGDEGPAPILTRWRHRAGHWVWLEQHLVPVRDEQDELVAIEGISRDVTARRLLAAALRSSEGRYRALVDAAQEGIWITDADDRVVQVNMPLAELLGYRPEELVGVPPWAWTVTEDQPLIREQMVRRHRGESTLYEVRLRNNLGRPRWVRIHGTPLISPEGEYQGALAMVTALPSGPSTSLPTGHYAD
jgi:PAS domain S-box-containing protein